MAMSKQVKRFSKPVILAHWLNAFTFMLLYFTGLPLYSEWFDWVYVLFGGPENARFVHHYGGLVFILPTVFILLVDAKSFTHWMKQIFSWKAHDFAFFKGFAKEFFGLHADIPKQDFYNAGEKINSLLQVFTAFLLIVSGLLMWFADFFTTTLGFSQSIILLAYPMHSIAFGLSVAVVVGHVYLSIGHPNSRPSMQGILKGYISEDYAKAHHGKWYDEEVKDNLKM
jgi:formate dehydrogenase subunit gamma